MKHKLPAAIAAVPLSVLLAWGAIQAMVTAFGLPVEDPGKLLLIWTLCALAGSGLYCFSGGSLVAVAGAFLGFAWLWRERDLSDCLQALITRLSRFYHNAYGWRVIEFAGMDTDAVTMDLLLICWGCVIILGAARAVVRGRGVPLAILLALPPLISTMVVTDTPPDALPLFAMLTAVALLLLTRFVSRQNPLQGVRLMALAAVPTALVLGGLLLLCPQENYVNKAEERLDALSAWWNSTVTAPFRRGAELGQVLTPTPTASASTRLSTIGPRIIIPYDVMEVTADFDGILYLRGQDYDVYDGLSWTSSTGRIEQLTPSRFATHRGTVTVTTRNSVGFQYLPSYLPNSIRLEDGRLANPAGTTEFSWSVSRHTLPNTFSAADGYVNYSSMMSYLRLPPATREWAEPYVETVLGSQGLNEPGEFVADDLIVECIVDHVAASAPYSLNTGRMDSSYDDFAQWFLEESDTGYCVHFASAAAVLLRAAGIPARYVTGYMVSCEKDQTVTVQSDRAHAWVEYYDEDLGTWVVAEPTPPDLEGGEPETESVTAPPPVTQPLTEPDAEETTAPAEETRPNANDPVNGGDIQVDVDVNEVRLWQVLRRFLLAAGLWLAVLIQRPIRIALRRRAFAGGPNRRALGLWHDVEALSRLLGREPPEELLELAQKAKFSQHRLTKEELRRFTDWLSEARQELNTRPLLSRLWCRYGLALW